MAAWSTLRPSEPFETRSERHRHHRDGFRHLQNLKELKDINSWNQTRVDDKSMEHLAALQSLQTVLLRKTESRRPCANVESSIAEMHVLIVRTRASAALPDSASGHPVARGLRPRPGRMPIDAGRAG